MVPPERIECKELRRTLLTAFCQERWRKLISADSVVSGVMAAVWRSIEDVVRFPDSKQPELRLDQRDRRYTGGFAAQHARTEMHEMKARLTQ
jgi:hypothetical protein